MNLVNLDQTMHLRVAPSPFKDRNTKIWSCLLFEKHSKYHTNSRHWYISRSAGADLLGRFEKPSILGLRLLPGNGILFSGATDIYIPVSNRSRCNSFQLFQRSRCLVLSISICVNHTFEKNLCLRRQAGSELRPFNLL